MIVLMLLYFIFGIFSLKKLKLFGKKTNPNIQITVVGGKAVQSTTFVIIYSMLAHFIPNKENQLGTNL